MLSGAISGRRRMGATAGSAGRDLGRTMVLLLAGQPVLRLGHPLDRRTGWLVSDGVPGAIHGMPPGLRRRGGAVGRARLPVVLTERVLRRMPGPVVDGDLRRTVGPVRPLRGDLEVA